MLIHSIESFDLSSTQTNFASKYCRPQVSFTLGVGIFETTT